MPFPGEASHTYFFRRKVSASRILQVPGALFLGFFQKLFAVCASHHPKLLYSYGYPFSNLMYIILINYALTIV
jgi:hypothetical protein